MPQQLPTADLRVLQMLSSSDVGQNQLGLMLLGEDDCALLSQQFAEGITYHDGVLTVAPKSMIAKRLKSSWRYVVALRVLAVLGRHKSCDSLSFPPRCTLSDLSPLAQYGHLKSLALPPPGGQAYDLDVLRACSELRSLSLPGDDRSFLWIRRPADGHAAESVENFLATNPNPLDISVLASLPLLESIELSGAVVDAAMLAGTPNLRRLVLAGCVVRHPAALTSLPRLEYLNLDRALIEGDIPSLLECPALTEVQLKYCTSKNAADGRLKSDDELFKEIKAAVKKRQSKRPSSGQDESGTAFSPAEQKKITKLLRAGDATNVALACELMDSCHASPHDWLAVLTPSVLKSLVRRWDPDVWERLTAVSSGISVLAPPLQATVAEQFAALATDAQNQVLSDMLRRGTAAGDMFLKIVLGGLRKFVRLEVNMLSADAANTLVAHPGWDLWVITQQPLSDEVVETLCGCLSTRLHLPGLSSQSLGPRAAAAVESRGLGHS